jgi:hypothetical protein
MLEAGGDSAGLQREGVVAVAPARGDRRRRLAEGGSKCMRREGATVAPMRRGRSGDGAGMSRSSNGACTMREAGVTRGRINMQMCHIITH